jgi:hypothetical protein
VSPASVGGGVLTAGGGSAPAPGTEVFDDVVPFGPVVAIAGGAGLVLLALICLVVWIRGPRSGLEGRRRAERNLGAVALYRAAGELRPSLTDRQVPAQLPVPARQASATPQPVVPRQGPGPAPSGTAIPEEVRTWLENRDSH